MKSGAGRQHALRMRSASTPTTPASCAALVDRLPDVEVFGRDSGPQRGVQLCAEFGNPVVGNADRDQATLPCSTVSRSRVEDRVLGFHGSAVGVSRHREL